MAGDRYRRFFARADALLVQEARSRQGRALTSEETAVPSSINQSTVLQALGLLDNRVFDSHHKAAEILNAKLIEVPGNTLGKDAPHISRLIATLETMEKKGILHCERNGKYRYSLIELVRAEAHPVSATPVPSDREAPVVVALAQLGGAVEDSAGQVTVALREIVDEKINRTEWRNTLEDAERHGFIARVLDKGRAVRIELTDQGWDWYKATYGEPEPTPASQEAADEAPEEEPVAVVEAPSTPSLQDEAFADMVAVKLLEKVIARAQAPYVEPAEHERVTKELLKVQEKLEQAKAQATAATNDKKAADDLYRAAEQENTRLTKQVSELMETIDDIAAERDEWRRKYGQLEQQVSALTPTDKKKRLGADLRGLIAED